MFCSGNLFRCDVQMANKNFHKLRFKAIFGLESTISTTSVQYFLFLLGFSILQMGLYFLKSLWRLAGPLKPVCLWQKIHHSFTHNIVMGCLVLTDLTWILKKITGGGLGVEISHSMFLFYTAQY